MPVRTVQWSEEREEEWARSRALKTASTQSDSTLEMRERIKIEKGGNQGRVGEIK